MPALLTVVTCGIYYFWWQYVTTEELRLASGRDDLNPMTDLIITILCCGIWAIFVQYRNAQIVHETLTARGVHHEDKSTFIVILHLLSAVVGATGLVAILILQDEYNKLADAGAGPYRGPATF